MTFIKGVLVVALLVVVVIGAMLVGRQIFSAGYDAGRTECGTSPTSSPAPTRGVNRVPSTAPARR